MAWFRDWFNTPYYHILYGKRNTEEANHFIRNIGTLLRFESGQSALDLACGKGRHSRELAKFGLRVYGIDLSEESIHAARKYESEHLSFDVHDMRKVYRKNYFDYVFNLFTSFGYFNDVNDNLLTLQAVKENLKPSGIFVQDYFNARCVSNNLIPFHEETIEGITFRIEKKIVDNKILKSISFSDKGEDYRFTEEVSLFSLQDFETMYRACGMKINAVYGDYELNAFDPNISNRIILISSPL